jgi:hypothetical protein
MREKMAPLLMCVICFAMAGWAAFGGGPDDSARLVVGLISMIGTAVAIAAIVMPNPWD